MNYYNNTNNESIEIKDIYKVIIENFKFITISTFVLTAIVAALTLLLPNIYSSSATLSINDNKDSDISSIIGSGSGLIGSLSNNFLPSLASNNENAISVLLSRDFFKILYDSDDFLIYLMATKSYDPISQKTFIDQKQYDTSKKKWVRKVSHPYKIKPSLQEAHRDFLEMFNVIEDDDNNVIIFIFEHKSATFAESTLNEIIFEINKYIRHKKIDEAKKGIDYIEKKMAFENISEIRDVLANVMEADIQTLALAEKSEEFIFKIVDSPFVPEKKLKPKRTIICLAFAFLSAIFFSTLVLLLNSDNKRIVFNRLIPEIKSK